MKLYAPGQYDPDQLSFETGLYCDDEIITQQQFKDDADINIIMERFNKTGQVFAPIQEGQFGDFSDVTDYHTAMNQVTAAQQAFMAMPAKIRSRFDNDAGAFVEFVLDENNRAEGIELGIFEGDAGHTGSLDVSVPTDTTEGGSV